MDDAEKKLDEDFCYNAMLAKALLQLLPANERTSIRVWIEKITGYDKTKEEKTMRNEYMQYILLALQNDNIIDFFRNKPPLQVIPIRESVSINTLESLALVEDQKTLAWLEELSEKNETLVTECLPENFIGSQPTPKDGVVCYIAAFSDE